MCVFAGVLDVYVCAVVTVGSVVVLTRVELVG